MANTKIPVELSSTPGIVDNSNANAITIDSSENVAIGSSTADAKLHVETSGQTQLRIKTSSSSSEPQMIMIDGAGDYFAMQKVDKGMTFKPQGSEVMRVESNAVYAGDVTGIPRDSLQCHFEVLQPNSNDGTNTWTNLVGGNNITLTNIGGPTYAFQGEGSNYFEINNNSSWTMTSPTAARVSSATVAFWIHSNNPQFLYLRGGSDNNYIGANSSSNGLYHGNAGSPTTYYNYSTTGNLYERNLNSTGQWAWVEFNGVDLTDANWDTFGFATYGSFEPQDHHTALGGFFVWSKAISSAERHQAIQYLYGKYGNSPTWQTHIALVSAGGAHGSALNSPFAAYGSGFVQPSYYRDNNMMVHLRGLASISGTANANDVMFTLPKGFRPSQRKLFTTQTNPNVDVRLDVLSDGSVITIESMTAWVSIDGLSFLANGE